MKPVIEFEGVSKEYKLGEKRSTDGLRHQLARLFQKKETLHSRQKENQEKSFFALKDVSFTLNEGEVLGVIGRNGAGKSTLLKIMSRITPPTHGRIVVRGKLASLLEVGTGFHPELTGRENIFLNGTILGMTQKEVRKKFDEIVAFAETEKFIDTPVKHYSSGMYVRLAFSVAAHLESDILVIDEVLAVGDIKFQERCFGTIRRAVGSGRTVILVSHNMPSVTSLCRQGLLLQEGRLTHGGPISDVVLQYYQQGGHSSSCVSFDQLSKKVGDEIVELKKVSIMNQKDEVVSEVDVSDSWQVEMVVDVLKARVVTLIPNLHFYNSGGICVFIVHGMNCSFEKEGRYKIKCVVPENLLNDGAYFISVAVSSYDPTRVHFYEHHCITVNVRDGFENLNSRPRYSQSIPGVVRPLLKWHVNSN